MICETQDELHEIENARMVTYHGFAFKGTYVEVVLVQGRLQKASKATEIRARQLVAYRRKALKARD